MTDKISKEEMFITGVFLSIVSLLIFLMAYTIGYNVAANNFTPSEAETSYTETRKGIEEDILVNRIAKAVEERLSYANETPSISDKEFYEVHLTQLKHVYEAKIEAIKQGHAMELERAEIEHLQKTKQIRRSGDKPHKELEKQIAMMNVQCKALGFVEWNHFDGGCEKE